MKSHCDGLATMQQIESAKGVKRRIAHGFFGEIILIQRKLGSHDGNVAHGTASSGVMKIVLPLT